jgi:hypothetical protein
LKDKKPFFRKVQQVFPVIIFSVLSYNFIKLTILILFVDLPDRKVDIFTLFLLLPIIYLLSINLFSYFEFYEEHLEIKFPTRFIRKWNTKIIKYENVERIFFNSGRNQIRERPKVWIYYRSNDNKLKKAYFVISNYNKRLDYLLEKLKSLGINIDPDKNLFK